MQKLVFVVDDNDSNLILAALTLEDEYRVMTMPSAKKMFSLLEKKRPDLILLDVEMPEMSGIEAASKLKENPEWSGIPVIFLTGLSDIRELLNDAADSGAIGIIKKPFNPPALLKSVMDYI